MKKKFEFKINISKLFSKVVFGIIVYILIMSFGLFINALVKGLMEEGLVSTVFNIVIMILTYTMLYTLGLLTAKNTDGIKKYSLPFFIIVIFGSISIIATMLLLLGLDSGIALPFIYIYNLFMNSNAIVIDFLSGILHGFTGLIGVIISILMIILGVRKNIKNIGNKEGV